MKNALTVDVEDWFQVSNFDSLVKRSEWESMPSRVEANTTRLLDLFDEYEARGTFFVLGWVAEHYPNLVREIAERGHEIASHGYGHELVYEIGPDRFSEDLRRSVQVIESASGVRPRGYRAPSFSIDHRAMWAFDVLLDEGFEFDSSVYPVRHPRYGLPEFSRVPCEVETPQKRVIREFPLTTLRILGKNLGASGGGYLRIFPISILSTAFREMNRRGEPAVLYIHPWEIDPDQPKMPVQGLGRFTHYRNLDETESRLRTLLERFEFTTATDAYALAAERGVPRQCA